MAKTPEEMVAWAMGGEIDWKAVESRVCDQLKSRVQDQLKSRVWDDVKRDQAYDNTDTSKKEK